MWMLALLAVALVLGLSPMPERRARWAVVPMVLAVVGYQALKYGMF